MALTDFEERIKQAEGESLWNGVAFLFLVTITICKVYEFLKR